MAIRVFWQSFWVVVFGCITLSGCVSLPPQVERPKSTKLTSAPDSRIAKHLAKPLAQHPGQSGVISLFDGLDAMVARLSLIHAADTSIDLQYYIYRNDNTGRLIAWQLLEAAERGVRVRVLLDDTASATIDRELLRVSQHPNISVRLYNPSAYRTFRTFAFVDDFSRMNHRMHNKSLTVDNRLSIVGGRNIGNEYFSNDEAVEFSDLDLLLAGPVVDEISDQFDAYWNAQSTYDVAVLATALESKPDVDFHKLIASLKLELSDHPYLVRLEKSSILLASTNTEFKWYFGSARVLVDPPEKRHDNVKNWMVTSLVEEFANTKQNVVIISPYFVPTDDGVKLLNDMVKRGVDVTVITNSLAATDVLAVHSGYQGYRERLLRGGVKLFEVKSSGRKPSYSWKGSSRSSLHAKSFIFDDNRLFVGSFNFDPRSAWVNTEMGVLVDQAEMNKALREWLPGFLQKNTYEVRLADDGLYWHDLKTGIDVYAEPQAGFWRRLMADFLTLFPLESQL